MTELTHEDIVRAMAAKANQLNAIDLVAGPITVKIVGARLGDEKQPVVLEIEGHEGKPWKPCKTMVRILVEVWKDKTAAKFDPERFIGQCVTLYRDPDVKYGGDTVGGVRIRHPSGMDKPRTFLVTETRGKTVKKTIYPIITTSPEDQASAPSSPSVTQERLDWLKVSWAKKHAEVLAPDDDKKLLFEQWVQQTLGENLIFDVTKCADWSPEDMEQCEEAVKAAVGDAPN